MQPAYQPGYVGATKAAIDIMRPQASPLKPPIYFFVGKVMRRRETCSEITLHHSARRADVNVKQLAFKTL